MERTKFRHNMEKITRTMWFSILILLRKPLAIVLLKACILFTNLSIIFPNNSGVFAQDVVTVTADQPNVWTLEQAHYLLAQMHRRNLDLKAKGLSELDANEVNGINIDILKSILEVGATYDGAARFNNNLTRQDKTFDAERRRQLTNEIDDLNKEKLELTRAIAVLRREYEIAENEDKRTKIQAEINEKLEIKSEVDNQIESKRNELNSLSSANGTVTNTTSNATFDASKFPAGFIDSEIKAQLNKALQGVGANPSLNASLQLDKFLQLQYEIVSKQLTLLRDEVGPGEKLLFLEMPQSINAPYNKSNKMWAQSRWRISGYTGCVLEINGTKIPCHKVLYPDGIFAKQNRQPRTTLDIFESVTTDSETSFFEKLKFSIEDIKDRSSLARRFVRRDEKDKDGKYINQKDYAFFNSFSSGITADASETQAESEYKQSIADYKEADAAYNALAKDCAKKRTCDDQRTKENLETESKKLKESEAKLSKPSPILFNLILKYLNKGVDNPNNLNKLSDLTYFNTSKRNSILSKISENETKDEKAKQTTKLLNRLWVEDFFLEELFRLRESDFQTDFYDLRTDTKKVVNSNITVNNRVVRTIEIIPRQSSLNVNDVQVRNKSSVFNFIFSSLFGIGANFNYQQQRERFSQFVQQELYSSGFGKGSREFGWTFTNMPGTKKLLSGTRNTYAILVVPQEATSLVIESTGCAFRRAEEQPKTFDEAKGNTEYCSEAKNFVIPIPGGGNDSASDFFVSGLTYKPVEKGKRIVVSVYGENFSKQIGILVDGVPLLESLGLAQNLIRDDSRATKGALEDVKSEKVKGSFERVADNQIVLSFNIPEGTDGTPLITLIAPGKSVDLNFLNLYVNGNYGIKLDDADWMFGKKPSTRFRVSDVQIFVSKSNDKGEPTELTALITGKSLVSFTNVFVNGIDPATCQDDKLPCIPYGSRFWWGTGNVYQMKFPPPTDEKIQIVLVSDEDVLRLNPISNPAKKEKPKDPPTLNPSVLSLTVKQIVPVFDEKRTKILQILVEIEGKGLNPDLAISIGSLDVVSETNAFITIIEPKLSQTIRLTDGKKNVFTTVVVETSEILKELAKPRSNPTPSPTPSPSS